MKRKVIRNFLKENEENLHGSHRINKIRPASSKNQNDLKSSKNRRIIKLKSPFLPSNF